MDTRFEIGSDLEFYCYLKAHLPDEYEILSEPRRSYYSEWDFNYQIYHNGQLVEQYVGDFRDLEVGYLMREAERILASTGAEDANRQ
jgi:hypothetical protein